MEIKEIFNLAGQPWEQKEDEQLIKEYNNDKLNLIDISKIHKRMPGGIISRLKHLNIVVNRHEIRGYNEYIQSDLYNKITKLKEENKPKIDPIRIVDLPENKEYTERKMFRLQRKQIPSDIIQLKKDVKEIKDTVNKIFELMNTVYEFEKSQE